MCRVEVTPVPTENTLLRYQTTTQSIRNFRAGDTVDLSCNKNHRDRTMWYGQKNNRAPFIIISAEMTLKHSEHPSMKFYWGYNYRINVTWNRTNNSIGLTIKNINESDEGFYFCTVGDGIFTTPGSGHILTVEESHSTSTQTPVSTTEQKTSSGDSEQCGTAWTLVTVFCSTTMLLTALVILVIQKNRGG
ncbi:hypothetical protein NFI96_012017 [Prochilodus magdalenae]|nr:hypothetical protein NFI96_012017 [Prochilodus magdalenae]